MTGKIVLGILGVAVVVVIVIFFMKYVSTSPTENPEPMKGNNSESDDYQSGRTLEVVEFNWSHSGMSMEDCYSFSVKKKEDGAQLGINVFAGIQGYVEKELFVEEPVMDVFSKLAREYDLDRWNGFDESDSSILDGSIFTLTMVLDDGTKITAHGSNSFPPKYSSVASEIQKVFKQLVYDYGDVYPKTLTSDDLENVYFNFNNQALMKKFTVSAQKNDSGNVDLNINISGYDAFSEEGFQYQGEFEGEFPFQAIQSIVRKYDIPTWNGWDRYDNNDGEYFSVSLYYESEEAINAGGSSFPEHYEGVKEEIIAAIYAFITENQTVFM